MGRAEREKLESAIRDATNQVAKPHAVITPEMRGEVVRSLLMLDTPSLVVTSTVFGLNVLPDGRILVMIAPYIGDLDEAAVTGQGVAPFEKIQWSMPAQMAELLRDGLTEQLELAAPRASLPEETDRISRELADLRQRALDTEVERLDRESDIPVGPPEDEPLAPVVVAERDPGNLEDLPLKDCPDAEGTDTTHQPHAWSPDGADDLFWCCGSIPF